MDEKLNDILYYKENNLEITMAYNVSLAADMIHKRAIDVKWHMRKRSPKSALSSLEEIKGWITLMEEKINKYMEKFSDDPNEYFHRLAGYPPNES